MDGAVSIKTSCMNGRKLCVRIPLWCRSFKINCAYTMENGYAVIDAADAANVELVLDMPVVLMESNPNVVANTGKVAVMRGPIVYCIEAKDNGERIFDLIIDANPEAVVEDNAEYHMPVIKAKGWKRPAPEGDWLYRPFAGKLEETTLHFIPYYTFSNRGESDMRVWIPVRYSC